VAVARQRRVVRIDAQEGTAGPPIPIDGTPGAIAAGPRDVWVAVHDPGPGRDGKLVRIDPRAGRVTDTVEVTGNIRDVAVGGGFVWALSRRPSRVVRVEPADRELDVARLGGKEAFALTVGGGAVWATVPDINSVVRVDPRSLSTATIGVGEGPAGLDVLGPDIWVANQRESTLSRIDAATWRASPDRVPVPANPTAVAAGGDTLWVTCVGANMLQAVPMGFRGPGA
jgi:hypothetical protein